MTDCLFCGIVAGDVPADIVLTTDTTVAFRDINPAPRSTCWWCHAATSTTRPRSSRRTREDVVDIVTAARQVAEAEGIASPNAGYRLVFNVGADAAQLGSPPARARDRRPDAHVAARVSAAGAFGRTRGAGRAPRRWSPTTT